MEEPEGDEESKKIKIGRVENLWLESLVCEWVQEVEAEIEDEAYWEEDEEAWDDVSGEALPLGLVREGRLEEVEYMEGRNIWSAKLVQECWERTGKAPVSVTRVDHDKGMEVDGKWKPLVRFRYLARDIKRKDKAA